jgi:hypothetical protein
MKQTIKKVLTISPFTSQLIAEMIEKEYPKSWTLVITRDNSDTVTFTGELTSTCENDKQDQLNALMITKCQNYRAVGGKWYKAVYDGTYTCIGCAFNTTQCSVIDIGGICSVSDRKDGKSKKWVLMTAQEILTVQPWEKL